MWTSWSWNCRVKSLTCCVKHHLVVIKLRGASWCIGCLTEQLIKLAGLTGWVAVNAICWLETQQCEPEIWNWTWKKNTISIFIVLCLKFHWKFVVFIERLETCLTNNYYLIWLRSYTSVWGIRTAWTTWVSLGADYWLDGRAGL